MPLKRVEQLEAQFRALMGQLAAREESRDTRPMETSLKELASYLADSRQWQTASDQRMKGVEDRLDRLSTLVARSNAAIAATAKGLEIVAGGTGETLARATAGIVIAKLGEKIDRASPGERLDELGRQITLLAETNPTERLEQLGREVAHLSAQSRINSRSTEDRLDQIEIAIKDKARPLSATSPAALPPVPLQSRAKSEASERSSRDELESYLNRQPLDAKDDYDHDMIAAAQRAARLADAATRNAPSRNGSARYQIPYGDFLPEDDNAAPRAGLILAVVILLLAGAVMLFLKAKEWTLNEPKPAAMLEHRPLAAASATARQDRRPTAVLTIDTGDGRAVNPMAGVPVVTGSTPAAPPLGAKPMDLWVAAKTPEPAPAKAAPQDADATVRQAAVQGDAKAQFSVGQSYLSGANLDSDVSDGDRLSSAARWFRRAAEAGHAPSQYRLGRLYELGRGAPRDLAEAEKWYGIAAAQGHVLAMHSLAMLVSSQNRRSANYLTAARWFREAATYGLIESQFNLGVLCESGLGLRKNLNEAYFWFAVAARQNDTRSAQKRDDIGRLLSADEREKTDRRVAVWTAKPRLEGINRVAPEPPVAFEDQSKPALPNPAPAPAPVANTAVMRANWKTDIAATAKTSGNMQMIAEAQRLLTQMGYKPGPVDGVPGPRTEAAIRSFPAPRRARCRRPGFRGADCENGISATLT